jgi:hypothetical protein
MNLQQMFGCMATDLSAKLSVTLQRMAYSLKNARFLSDGCCCCNGMGNKILICVSWRWVNEGFHAAPEKKDLGCEVR